MKTSLPNWLSTALSFVVIILIFVAFFTTHVPQKPPVDAGEENTADAVIKNAPNFTHKITIGTKEIMAADATTEPERELGLSDSAPLTGEEGMLFWFGPEGAAPFWMKDMKYPLDIIWIGSDHTVSEVTSDISPDTYPETFFPKKRAWYVLEVRAGFAKENNITAGTPVTF